MFDAVLHAAAAGCPVAHAARLGCPATTLYPWFVRLREEGAFATLDHHLLLRDRERLGRPASPSAAVIDSQSVKSAEAGGPRGYDAGKKIKGRKRHAMADTGGRTLVLQARPASIQDRHGALPLLKASRRGFPLVEHAFADRAYAADRVATAARITLEIVRKHPHQVGFTVHPRRWVIERLFGWIGRNRRLGKNFEATIASTEAFLYAASVMLLTRRLARAA